jgi:hypothetical protein
LAKQKSLGKSSLGTLPAHRSSHRRQELPFAIERTLLGVIRQPSIGIIFLPNQMNPRNDNLVEE